MASSGNKRPFPPDEYDRRGSSSSFHGSRRDKPKDWRDAFLDDEPRRSHRDEAGSKRRDERDRPRDHSDRDDARERDRDRMRDDRRRDVRDRGDRNDRDTRHHDRGREADRDRDGRRDFHREREHGREGESTSQRHGDTSDRRDASAVPKIDKEEGELDPSPPKQPVDLVATNPSSPGPSVANRYSNGHVEAPPTRGTFRPIAIPTGPKSKVPQTRALSDPSDVSEGGVLHLRSAVNGPGQDSGLNEPVVVLEEDKDPEKTLEERRRKREEILARFKSKGASDAAQAPATPGASANVGTGVDSVVSAGLQSTDRGGVMTGTSTGATPLLRQLGTTSISAAMAGDASKTPDRVLSLAATPQGGEFDLAKTEEDGDEATASAIEDKAGISAADYDPTADRQMDEEKRRKDAEVADGVGEPVTSDVKPSEEEYDEVETEIEEEDDEVDMFAAFDGEEKPKKKRKVTVRRLKNAAPGDSKSQIIRSKAVKAALEVVDNVDDTDGYYRITPGEVFDDGRYQITINLGKGMFSAVVKAKVLKAVDQERRQDVVGKEVAIKVIRSQQSMYVAGRKEAGILKKLNDADPEDKKHILRLERTFEHRGHLCIVTESLSMNLRDVIKRFGKDVGLNMRAVRAYAHQLFLSLSLMRKCSIVHGDVKPDNILVSENKAVLKMCDFGSAAEVSEGDITPYLVSRFYRAPEIILGLPYDFAIDVWSIGCTLFELFTGKILFPGRSNNQMLLFMMETKGKISHRMIKKAAFGEMHFDESNNFISIEKDKITGQDTLKTLALSKATKDLRSRLLPPSSVQLKMKDDELKLLLHFVDLLDKSLHLDPARRITPREALLHPFLAG